VTLEAIGSFATAAVAFAGLNLGALRWMLERYRDAAARDLGRFEKLEHELFEMRAALPLEYVRREDWIRFSATLDAKLDAMREEMREEIGAIKEKLYV
jgi:hypothetical protein